MKVITLLFFFYSLLLLADEDYSKIDREAAAYLAAKDHKKAASLYQDLNQAHLLPWQKSRLQYNLATLYLSQNLSEKALELYQEIDPIQLSLPQLAKNLQLNAAYAFLEMAHQETLLAKKLFLTRKSLSLIQEIENEDSPLLLPAKKYLESLKQEERKEWIEEASSLELLAILQEALLTSGKAVRVKTIWKALEKKMEQKKEWEKAFDYYQRGLEEIKQKNGTKAAQWFKQSEESPLFGSLASFSESQRRVLKDKLFLLSSSLNKGELNEINQQIETSALDYPKASNVLEARFFLYLEIKKFSEKRNKSALSILETLVNDSKTSLNLFYLYSLMERLDEKKNRLYISLMNREKEAMIQRAKSFIPAVISEQKSAFDQRKVCQQDPWKEVIPLFEKGFIAPNEEERFHFWSEALKKLKEPSDADPNKNQLSNEMNETMRLLEEMHSEDRPKQSMEKGVLDRW